jgi:LytS/YehU family sensor histidine kinase
MPSPRRAQLLAWLAWSALIWGAISLARVAIRLISAPRPLRQALLLVPQALAISLPWAIATPGLIVLAARLPWRRGYRLRTVSIHLAGLLLMSLVDAAWSRFVLLRTGLMPAIQPEAWYLVRLDQTVFLYLALTAIGVAGRHQSRLREAALRAARLEGRLLQARLQALALQLQPHFLFNTLNAVSELVHRDAAAARRMIADLRDLLRRSLDGSARQEVPLEEELGLLEAYAGIQRTRFAGTLTVAIDAPAETRRALVPRLVLQPLVENAIRHGIAHRAGPGRVSVRTRQENGRLVLEVADDGIGIHQPNREGMGLGITRARLSQLYGLEGRLTLQPAPGRGTVARMDLPWRLPGGEGPAGVPAPDPETPIDTTGATPASASILALALAAAWVIAGAIGAHEDVLAGRLEGTPISFRDAVDPRMGEALLWLFLSPAVLWLGGWLARRRLGPAALAGTHGIGCLAAIGLHLGLVILLVSPDLSRPYMGALLIQDLSVYAALAAGVHAWTVRRLAGERALRAVRLEGELSAARLRLLRWRLRPEFLDLSLDAIARRAEREPARADELTGRLGELLRLLLAGPEEALVPLQREIDLLRAYLVVEGELGWGRRRLQSALDPDAAGALVPAMLLQPLADAVAPLERGRDTGRPLHLTARCDGDSLVLTLGGEGAPSSDAAERVRDSVDRIERLCGAPLDFALRSDRDGAELRLRIPRAIAARPDGAGQAVA